jgi:hypothetical protein
MLQLEDELLGKGRGNVKCQGPNGLGGSLGLGLGIRSSPCLGVSNPLYLKGGDVSI